MQDGMLSTVRRIDERKDRYEVHLAVGEGNRPGVGVSVQSIRRFDLERVQRIFLAKGLSTIVRPLGARSAAPVADALSRKAPVR